MTDSRGSCFIREEKRLPCPNWDFRNVEVFVRPNVERLETLEELRQVVDGAVAEEIVRSDLPDAAARPVALISGGGSGHEPGQRQLRRRGMLVAAVAGDVFTSPSLDAVLPRSTPGSGDRDRGWRAEILRKIVEILFCRARTRRMKPVHGVRPRFVFRRKGCTMLHKGFVVCAVAVGLWVTAKTTNFGSYAGTLWSQARSEAKRHISTKFEIERARHEVTLLDKDVAGMIRPIAEYKAALLQLDKDIRRGEASIDERREALLRLTRELEKSPTTLTVAGRAVTL